MEKILRIEDTVFNHGDKYSHQYEGFVITTDKQAIKIGVSNDSDCCEHWGHIASEESFEDFIGAELKSISIVDSALNSKVLKEINDTYAEPVQVMYVNMDTNQGVLQFTVYNSHNGYYGHTAIVVSDQVTHEDVL